MNKNDKKLIAQKIRTQYVEKEPSEIDALCLLDARVKRPAKIFSYVFGSIGAIIMGMGMSLIMTDIGAIIGMQSGLVPGVIIGIVGMLMAIFNYPIYKKILKGRKKTYGAEIISISDKIINN